MASITITILDEGPGVRILAHSDGELPEAVEDGSPAERIALTVIGAIREIMVKEGVTPEAVS